MGQVEGDGSGPGWRRQAAYRAEQKGQAAFALHEFDHSLDVVTGAQADHHMGAGAMGVWFQQVDAAMGGKVGLVDDKQVAPGLPLRGMS